jgi:alkylhydroperoxidase family enzyme
VNDCGYCVAAHTAVGRLVGVDEGELARSRAGESSDGEIAAALRFARAVNEKRGGVSDDDLAVVRAAGYDDADITAIVGHVALNVLTNYFNRVAQIELDFPKVERGMHEAA